MLEELLEETKEIIASAEEEMDCLVNIVPDKSPYLSRALISARQRNGGIGQIVVAYNPEAASIDYAIAHELVRFLRFLRAPPEAQYLIASDESTRSIAFAAMEKDLEEKPPKLQAHISRGFGYFYDGILTQLLSTPGDFWINQYLYSNHPRLHDEIRKGVDEIFQRAHQSHSPKIEAITPKTIYRASHGMNAALGLFLGEMLSEGRYARIYRETPHEDTGRLLFSLNPADRGHQGDREATESWAGVLGLSGWYKWKKA